MDYSYTELAKALSAAVGVAVDSSQIGDTGMFEAECFELSCVIDGETLEIRNVETFQSGCGRRVIAAIHEYCDTHILEVFASNVKESAVNFWYKMGYVEGQTSNEFFRV